MCLYVAVGMCGKKSMSAGVFIGQRVLVYSKIEQEHVFLLWDMDAGVFMCVCTFCEESLYSYC